MRIIAGKRQCGKSTKLVDVALATNGYILVHNPGAMDVLVRLGMPRDRILRIHDFQGGNLRGRTLDGPLYVDNLELVFAGIMSVLAAGKFSAGVAAATISLSPEDVEIMVNQKVDEIILNSEES